jgi:hypothetical protein
MVMEAAMRRAGRRRRGSRVVLDFTAFLTAAGGKAGPIIISMARSAVFPDARAGRGTARVAQACRVDAVRSVADDHSGALAKTRCWAVTALCTLAGIPRPASADKRARAEQRRKLAAARRRRRAAAQKQNPGGRRKAPDDRRKRSRQAGGGGTSCSISSKPAGGSSAHDGANALCHWIVGLGGDKNR